MSRKPAKKSSAPQRATRKASAPVAKKGPASAKTARPVTAAPTSAKTTSASAPAAAGRVAVSNNRILIYALGAALLVGVGYLAFSFTQYTRSPAYSVQQALYAVQHHDLAGFDKQVDTARVSAYLVDDLLTPPEIPTLPEGAGRTQNELLGLLKPDLSKTVEAQMLGLVEKGWGQAEASNLLEAMTTKIWNADTSLAGIETKSQDGKNAVVALTLFRADFNNTLALNLRLLKTDGQWEVVAVDNLPAILQQLDRFAAARRDAANKQVAAKINASLVPRDFQKGEVADSHALLLRLSFENTGTQAITGFAAAVVLYDSNRTVLGQFNVTSDKTIAPGAFLEQSWPFKLDGQNPDHTALLATPNDKLGHQVEIYSLTLADGSTLVYEK